MRPRNALTRAMRTRRGSRLGLTEADRLVAGDPAGPEHEGVGHVLDAARAPATEAELGGERAMAAALAAARRRAVPTTTPKGRPRVRVPVSARNIVVTIATGLAILSAGGTAVAARTGNLPAGAQQHAHRLFSALGVPAPRTGSAPTPAPAGPPVATPQTVAPSTPAPPATTAPDTPVGWCRAWQAGAGKGKAMNARSRRALVAAAGGEDEVTAYCARLTASASPDPTATTGAGATSRGRSSNHPTPHATTPSHPGKAK